MDNAEQDEHSSSLNVNSTDTTEHCIIQESQQQDAEYNHVYTNALALLSKKQRSIKELKTKLLEKYKENVVCTVILVLQQEQYLSDDALCYYLAIFFLDSKPYSKIQITKKLGKKAF